MVRAKIVECNDLRRDVCECPNPECKGRILVCHAPGCDNFSKGGTWDDELCPDCTKTATKVGAGAVAAIIFVVSLGRGRPRA